MLHESPAAATLYRRVMIVFVLSVFAMLWACAIDVPAPPARDAEGGTTGNWGKGGTQSQGGSGGDVGHAGQGGSGGDNPIGNEGGWLEGSEHWTDRRFEGGPKNALLGEADVDELNPHTMKWEPDCGPHCEVLRHGRTYDALVGLAEFGTVLGADGPEVLLFNGERPKDGTTSLWSMLSLTKGRLKGLLRLRAISHPIKDAHFANNSSPNIVAILWGDQWLRGALDPVSERWEWKPPFSEKWPGGVCDRMAVGMEPPGFIDTCLSGITVYDAPGSSTPTFSTKEVNSWWGASYGHNAVWTHLPKGSTDSNAWIWSRDKGPRIAATLPGNLCAIHVSDSWIVGAAGGKPVTGGLCDDALEDQRFFRMDQEGGSLAWSRRFADPILLFISAATDEYAAVYAGTYPDRGRMYLLVRLSDWRIRRFYPRPERHVAKKHIGLDGDHFYFGDFRNSSAEDPDFEVRRYPLSQFEEIGEEFVPWAEDD